MVNFYRRFLPRLAHIVRPLTDSLSKAKKDPIHICNYLSYVGQAPPLDVVLELLDRGGNGQELPVEGGVSGLGVG